MEHGLRIIRLHQLLCSHRYPVPRRVMEERLECSRATLRRALTTLRDITRDPIPWNRTAGGYTYQNPSFRSGEIPSLWFRPDELHALLAVQHYLEQLEPGLLGSALAPLAGRTRDLLRLSGQSMPDVASYIRLVPLGTRAGRGEHFVTCAEGTLVRRRMRITYQGRGSGETTCREISPQYLVHYRDNWYLTAFCHLREALRTFAVECIALAKVLDSPAQELPQEDLDAHLSSGYGIFAGPARANATLRFSAKRSRWVADEQWHPEQQGDALPDGRYELTVPYNDPTELLMDILRHGPEVEVMGPPELQEAVKGALQAALNQYT